jgi:hypothetical protein
MPWIAGGEASGDDIKRVYRRLASKLSITESTLIDTVKQNLLELLRK